MKILSIILASAITTAPPALEPAAIHLEPGQAVQCKAEGGCVVFNIPGLEHALSEAHAAGARETCGRGI